MISYDSEVTNASCWSRIWTINKTSFTSNWGCFFLCWPMNCSLFPDFLLQFNRFLCPVLDHDKAKSWGHPDSHKQSIEIRMTMRRWRISLALGCNCWMSPTGSPTKLQFFLLFTGVFHANSGWVHFLFLSGHQEGIAQVVCCNFLKMLFLAV